MKTYSVSITYFDFHFVFIHTIVEAENKTIALKLCLPKTDCTKVINKSVILIK